MAARTRSRASRTALSARPTTVKAGSPSRMSASTQTRRASTPSTAKVAIREIIRRRPPGAGRRDAPRRRDGTGAGRRDGPRQGRRDGTGAGGRDGPRRGRRDEAGAGRRDVPRRGRRDGTSERGLQVVEPDEVTGGVQEDAHGVEAQRGAVGAVVNLREP